MSSSLEHERETDVIDGEASHQLSSEFRHEGLGDDSLFYLNDTMQVDDTCPLEDAFETQLVDVDPAAGNQKVDFGVETQVLDDGTSGGRSVGAGINCSETVVESELSSQEKPGVTAVKNGWMTSQYPIKQCENVPQGSSDVFQNKELHSESTCRGFTDIRVASTRACGLAALAKGTLWKSLPEPQKCSPESEIRVEMTISPSDCDGTCEKPKSSSMVTSTTVRRLFREDDLDEVGLPDVDMNKSDANVDYGPKFMPSENCLTGLSYLDSQEPPGEQSQAHALEVVDNFIHLNAKEYEGDRGTSFQTTESAKVISGAKGCLDLAQNFVVQSKDGGGRKIYDWDEAREKDGGGDFFVRKKDILFKDETPKKKCLTEPRKSSCGRFETTNIKEKGRNGSRGRVAAAVYSDSRVLQDGLRSRKKSFCHTEDDFTSNLRQDACTSTGNTDFIDMDNVGPDTQMAAEAMETLFDELHTVGNGKHDPNAHLEQAQFMKPICIGVVPIKGKRVRGTYSAEIVPDSPPPKESKRNGCHLTSVNAKQKKLAGVNYRSSSGRKRQCDDASGCIVTRRTAKKRINVVETDPCEEEEEAGEPASCKSKQPRRGPANADAAESFDRCSSERTAKGGKRIACDETSSEKRCGSSLTACATPDDCVKKPNDTSPICMGDGYPERSCKKTGSRLSLTKELNSLLSLSPRASCEKTGWLRKRRDVSEISVLFSQHLDTDVVKHQEKILARLGGRTASSTSDASHFVADEFIRTRNMLEAIASGKPVVTPSWLESCGQAGCLVDDKSYILRDARKEKCFGFSLPVSLKKASQHPLLKGMKVWITPNAKPSKAVVSNLVKAVGGSPVEKFGRSYSQPRDDHLILTSEEDYEACVPFLEKGCVAYSTELVLNGIVVQKLEYERHRMFDDKVKGSRRSMVKKKKKGHK